MRKQLSIFAILAFISLGATAQTIDQTTGFKITPTVSAVDFRHTPLNDYKGTTAKQNLNLGLEAGYFGKEFGLSATVQSDFDLDSKALLGLKVYANLFTVQNISFKGAVGVQSFIEDVKGSQFQYKPEISAYIPLTKHFEAKVAGIGTFFGDDKFKKIYPGGAFGIAYTL